MTGWILVRRIQNGLLKKAVIGHNLLMVDDPTARYLYL
jgi:hypothetical protein